MSTTDRKAAQTAFMIKSIGTRSMRCFAKDSGLTLTRVQRLKEGRAIIREEEIDIITKMTGVSFDGSADISLASKPVSDKELEAQKRKEARIHRMNNTFIITPEPLSGDRGNKIIVKNTLDII